MTVLITSKTCKGCHAVREQLKAKGINFKEYEYGSREFEKWFNALSLKSRITFKPFMVPQLYTGSHFEAIGSKKSGK